MEGEEDLRLNDMEEGKQETTDANDYGDMIGQVDEVYNEQIQATEEWAQKQQQIQNEQTDFAIEQIEQQKAQAEEDYLKEQSGAYADWQKQSAQHGVNAEKMAAAGMQGTGYSESSQVSMYNTYQNRVAVAKESFSRATLNYNNAITQARMQNNAALAEIAYNAYQQQLQLSLEAFQYKNTLILKAEEQKRQDEREQRAWLLEMEKLKNEQNKQNQQGPNKIIKGVYFDGEPQPVVDEDRLTDLGLGPISAEEAFKLVQQGLLEVYEQNGKLYFRWKEQPQWGLGIRRN
jgi:hypothetical protein